MDIKSKSKSLHKAALVVVLYLFGLSAMLSIDILTHTEYFGSNPYFSSYEFNRELSTLFYNIKSYHIDYKGYSTKYDYDKLRENEIQNLKDRYEPELKKKEAEIQAMYKTYIDAATKLGDKEKATLLINERDKKLEDAKKENSAKIDAEVKAIVKLRDKDYFSLGRSLSQNKDIKYYIKNVQTSEIYSNLSGISNIEAYIKDSALYSVQFPNEDYRNFYFSSINSDFRNSDLAGYFIIPREIEGYSQIHANYNYYNSIGLRLGFEVLILCIALIGLCILGIYLKKHTNIYTDYIQKYIERALVLLRKIPLDLRFFVLFIIILVAIDYEANTLFFYTPLTLDHIFKLSFVTIINIYILISVIDIVMLIRTRSILKDQWRRSITYRVVYKPYCVIKDSFAKKNLIFKVILLTTLTILLGITFLIALFTYNGGNEFLFLLSAPYTFIYAAVLPIYLLRKLLFLNKIIEGSEQIASGNFDHTIDVKGKGNLSKLAHNINNLQSSFKSSLESQMKSEKMKSELITNVSHDLKTPLTSIINYVDLLKREDLSPEGVKDYIGVLDRKTQRLKILIEDLFEASKVTSGAVELNMEQVDIASLLHQALGEFDEKIKASSLIFKVNAPKQKIYANLDGKKTWRVFENLINNALKYSQPNTRVYIDLVEQASSVMLTVKNISSYEMDFDVEEIFERFKRGDKSRNTEGSGLGLAIAKSIIELQGGKLTIEIDGDLFKAIVEFFK